MSPKSTVRAASFVWVLLLLVTPVIGAAQDLADFSFVPTLVELGCNQNARACIFDASRPSQLFVYVVETGQLWKYPSNGGESTHYDLSPYQTAFGTTFVLDFVAISDTELVFIGTQFDTYQDELTIYSTETNHIRESAIDFGAIVITACDALLGPMPLDNLYAFPDSSRVLLCGVSQGHRKLIIADLAQERIERVIDIPVTAANPALHPWRKVLVGLDGNIYVQAPSMSNQDVRDVFGTTNRPPLLDDAVRVLRFNPLDATWTLLQLPILLLSANASADDIRTGMIFEVAGVDQQSNLYYWDNAYSRTGEYLPRVTVFDMYGRFMGQVPSQEVISAGAGTYIYQSVTGEIVFQDIESASVLTAINPTEFLPASLPSLSPTLSAAQTHSP